MGIKGREVVREPLFLMEFDCVCNVYIRPVALSHIGRFGLLVLTNMMLCFCFVYD